MASEIRTLIVGVGALRSDDTALLAAAELATRTGAVLHAVHAFDLPDPLLEAYARQGDIDPGLVDRYGEQLRGQLEELVRHAAPELSVTAHVRNGSAARVLAEIAAQEQADLLVIGAGGESRLLRFFLGSTADAAVRLASVPVLVVRQAPGWSLRRVLLTTDLSSFSGVVHERGLELVAALPDGRQAEVRSLLVVAYDAPLPPPLRPELLTEHAEAELRLFLAERLAPLANVQPRVRFGDAAREVLAEADEWAADLIVLGTHGRSGLARLMLGSVAGTVLRGATCSVLVIPAALLLAAGPPGAAQDGDAIVPAA